MTSPQQQQYDEALKKAAAKLKALSQELAAVKRQDAIAVIGMSCRFPGGANTPELFWELLQRGGDAITEIPTTRWAWEDYYDTAGAAPGKMSTKYGGFLQHPIETFDHLFFDLSAEEAAAMDPQQRLLLEVSWEALERAGLNIPQLQGSRTGVFIGISTYDYAILHTTQGPLAIKPYVATGTILSAAAGRLSFFYDFQGPSQAVDTACSSSLVALHAAMHSLQQQESSLALVGGVNLLLTPEVFIAMSQMGSLAPDGRCKSFDTAANGFGRGEGCGVLVLKRLAEARQDGDPILAIIKGTAVGHNGKSNGLTSPNPLAQEKVLRAALDKAQMTAADIDYLEAHGTGTKLGDPIELQAVGKVFAEKTPPLRIGTVKTNIGHLEAAAGMAGLIKILLALQYHTIPANLHLTNPNPYIPWTTLPGRVVTENVPWEPGVKPRAAGCSSFGLTGVNAHVILQETPSLAVAEPPATMPVREPAWHLLTLSTKTRAALHDMADRYQHYVATTVDALADICYTSNLSRTIFDQRLACVAQSRDDLTTQLAHWVTEPEQATVFASSAVWSEAPTKLAFVFSRASEITPGLGRELYDLEPPFEKALEACDALLSGVLGYSVLEALYTKPLTAEQLRAPRYAIPCHFALEYALAQLWLSWQITPTVIIGDGVGEYTAACVAGACSFEAAVRGVAEYAQALTLPSAPTAQRPVQPLERPMEMPLISTRTGQALTPFDVAALERQTLAAPDGASDAAIRTACQKGVRIFIGLNGLWPSTEAVAAHNALALCSLRPGTDAWRQVLTVVAQLYVNHYEIDWGRVHALRRRPKVILPTYPFQRQRHWLTNVTPPSQSQAVATDAQAQEPIAPPQTGYALPPGYQIVATGVVAAQDRLLDLSTFPNLSWTPATEDDVGLPVELYDTVIRESATTCGKNTPPHSSRY